MLVDLSTHTKGAKPGILAAKPARVQITHVASSGTVGLSTIDFKLTDRFADLPENAAIADRTAAGDGRMPVPYRHIEAAAEHPYHRAALGIPEDTIVIGAFSSALKLTRRCVALWREVLARIPAAKLAFSPFHPALRQLYLRLTAAGGIAPDRLLFIPPGKGEAEAMARYAIVDFVVDTMPYGGVNGVLEPLDAGVPVVTLLGKRHGERTAYSILANLGVTETVAQSGREYVDIAARLATDARIHARRARAHPGGHRPIRAHRPRRPHAGARARVCRSPCNAGAGGAGERRSAGRWLTRGSPIRASRRRRL